MQAATPLAAVFTFFVRDFAGMLGGILFAFWQVGAFRGHEQHYKLHCLPTRARVCVWMHACGCVCVCVCAAACHAGL